MPPRPSVTPTLVAKAVDLAGSDKNTAAGIVSIEAEVLERIKKCLERASHPNTSESEAQTALRMSSQLLDKFNVSQADLIATDARPPSRSTRGGQSTVRISNAKSPDSKVRGARWPEKVARAMNTFFDCKYHHKARTNSQDLTFYGIGVNTVAAALAFETMYNLVQYWTLSVKGKKDSYRLGVAVGLQKIADKEKADESKRLRDQEAAIRAGRSPNGNEARQSTTWQNSGAFILYRDNALKIAGDYLNAQGTKLSHRRKRTARIRDREAYQQGERDSKRVDIKRRRITN